MKMDLNCLQFLVTDVLKNAFNSFEFINEGSRVVFRIKSGIESVQIITIKVL